MLLRVSLAFPSLAGPLLSQKTEVPDDGEEETKKQATSKATLAQLLVAGAIDDEAGAETAGAEEPANDDEEEKLEEKDFSSKPPTEVLSHAAGSLRATTLAQAVERSRESRRAALRSCLAHLASRTSAGRALVVGETLAWLRRASRGS